MQAGKLSVLALTVAGGLMAGCAAAPKPLAANALYVPTAALVQGRGRREIDPANVLVMNDQDYWIGRDEKWVDGAVQEGGISAYTIYTWDAQRISDDQGSVGYRYRWMIQQGSSTP